MAAGVVPPPHHGRRQGLQQSFARWDRDCTGYIERSEFRAFVAKMVGADAATLKTPQTPQTLDPCNPQTKPQTPNHLNPPGYIE